MKCQLSGNNARIIAKAVQSLSKFGTDLFLQASKDGLQFRSLNLSQSAVCTYQFNPDFFINFSIDECTENYWKIVMKSCLAIFRKMKQVEHCEMCILLQHSKLQIKFNCRLETIKNSIISIAEEDHITAAASIEDTLNVIAGSHKMFNEVLSYFGTVEEITFEVQCDYLIVKNYIEGSVVNDKFMRSQLKLTCDEFDMYTIKKETSITFCLKEFRAFLQFAECLNEQIVLNFNEAGSPVFLQIKHDLVECVLIMSTLSLEDITLYGGNMEANASRFDHSETICLTRKRKMDITKTKNASVAKARKCTSQDTTVSNSSLSYNNLSTPESLCDTQPVSLPQQSDMFLMCCDADERNTNTEANDNEECPPSPNKRPERALHKIFSRCFELTYVSKEPSPSSQNYVDNSDPED